MCTKTYTNITGNQFIDLLILMAVGLLFIRLSFPSVYSELKEVRQEEKRIWRIIGILFWTISTFMGMLFFGSFLFLISILSMISKITCK
jgi:hypothetical protein